MVLKIILIARQHALACKAR